MSHRKDEGARQAQALVRHKTPWLLPLVLIALAAFSIQMATAKTSGNLPGGSSIEVDNTSPADGAQLLIPIGDTTLDILDEGSASVGAGVVIKDTTVVYVLDQSGSMTLGAGVDCTGDAANDTRDVCAQEGIAGANDAAADPFSAVGLTGIASYATAGANHDVDLGAGGTQLLVAPDHDGNANTVSDLEDVARTLDGIFGQQTNYAAGLTEAFAIINDASNTGAVNIILFLSDADNSSVMVGANVNTLAGSVPANTTIHAFGIGVGPSCTFDGGTGTLNNVAALSTAGTGTCQVIADVTQIADQITSAIGTTLISLEIQVDGGPFTPIPAGDIDIALPANGTFAPKTANYSTPVNDLGPGPHTICVRATGSDAGGTGDVTDCKTIRLLQLSVTPATETNELGSDDTHTVTATVAGDAGGTLVTFTVGGQNAGAIGTCSPNADCTTDATGTIQFTYSVPQADSSLGTDTITASITVGGTVQSIDVTKDWVDTTPPVGQCLESVNPNGKNTPPAGQRSPGQNEDGFYIISGDDELTADEDLQIFVTDEGSGTVFGPYPVGTVIKYTQDPDATPEAKAIGSANGQAGAVTVHIIGNGDATVTAVDGSGNVSDPVSCLVPPPPK